MSSSMFIAVTLAAAVLAPSPVDVLEPAFRNTIVSTYPDGKTTKLWLNRDGRYQALRANGARTAGSWVMKGDKVCMTQKSPIYIPLAFCTVIPHTAGVVGASWMAKGLKGEPVRHTLTAGR